MWFLACAARRVMGEKVASKYRTKLTGTVLEPLVVTAFTRPVFPLLASMHQQTLTGTVLGQLVGIAPTIIAVRVGLGYSVESVDSFVAPTPRTRVVSQFPGAPYLESVHEILYIRPISVKVETV
ncbi:hypothetical protein DFH09DRAFT_1100210 [Mycena vulgaris]|nr:hypothetical protein DFH09DRAFT_1100210 [Mycena vulgaris]